MMATRRSGRDQMVLPFQAQSSLKKEGAQQGNGCELRIEVSTASHMDPQGYSEAGTEVLAPKFQAG